MPSPGRRGTTQKKVGTQHGQTLIVHLYANSSKDVQQKQWFLALNKQTFGRIVWF